MTFNDCTIVFNGEIYNYIERRESLLKKGQAFGTTSDTEVLLHLYVEYSNDFVDTLNGMFAFIIFDKRKIKLFISRDHIENKPTLVIVVGDVSSTMACTIAAKKLCIDVAHVEGDIRSGDMTMPEEINRIATDAICDHYFTTSELANENLRNTGVSDQRIHFVGNTMIDTFYQNLKRLRKPALLDKYKLTEKEYFLLTLHWPANVDDKKNLDHLMEVILSETGDYQIIFPLHPGTGKNLHEKFLNTPKLIQQNCLKQ